MFVVYQRAVECMNDLKILTFFQKSFSVKFPQNLSAYSNYEYLQLKNTNFAINASGNSAKKLLILLRVQRGRLTLSPSPPHVSFRHLESQTRIYVKMEAMLMSRFNRLYGTSHKIKPLSRFH